MSLDEWETQTVDPEVRAHVNSLVNAVSVHSRFNLPVHMLKEDTAWWC